MRNRTHHIIILAVQHYHNLLQSKINPTFSAILPPSLQKQTIQMFEKMISLLDFNEFEIGVHLILLSCVFQSITTTFVVWVHFQWWWYFHYDKENSKLEAKWIFVKHHGDHPRWSIYQMDSDIWSLMNMAFAQQMTPQNIYDKTNFQSLCLQTEWNQIIIHTSIPEMCPAIKNVGISGRTKVQDMEAAPNQPAQVRVKFLRQYPEEKRTISFQGELHFLC